jgi:predicted CXXCH cytochrome family protein
MNKEIMKMRLLLFPVLIALGTVGAMTAVSAQENKFRLKPGARGKNCLACHVTFEDKIKQPSVHTPVKSGDCASCHNPHAATHGKLLATDTTKICFTCHPGMVPEKARSSHKVVAEGACMKCHDPHAAKNKFNLLEAGNALCFGCHKELGESVQKVKFKHNPVQKGCLTCHDPHAGKQSLSLLKDDVPGLCVKCHKTDKQSFQKQHMNYPVAKARCTSCHDPHGSDKAGILFTNVHRPVANKMCNQCHAEPTSPSPFATKKPGFELCRGCHSAMLNDAFSKNRIHWPLVDKTGCVHCHNPHGGPVKGLLKTKMIVLCGECHADSIERQQRSMTKHAPIKDGLCTTCHAPHASDNLFLFEKAATSDVCKTCHDYKQHSSHPIGESALDPRNKNVSVQCASCHGTHGTEYKKMLYYPTTTELCVQCHVEHKR